MTRKRALTILAAALALAVPTVALAHTITRTQIRAAAREAARSIKSQTAASSTGVLSCRRTSDHRGRCKVEARYSSGARRCVTVVGIRLVGEKARWRTGDTTCY